VSSFKGLMSSPRHPSFPDGYGGIPTRSVFLLQRVTFIEPQMSLVLRDPPCVTAIMVGVSQNTRIFSRRMETLLSRPDHSPSSDRKV